jgi:23S rRNA pseudouridine1911/1915/1917 synthase
VSGAKEARVEVPEALADERLDKTLAALVPELSRHHARRVLAMGAVTVNGRRVRMAGHAVRTGDRIIATWHDEVQRPEIFELNVVHQDTSVIVVHKPAGQLSQGSELGDVGALTWQLTKTFGQHVRLMHRLDKGTSGLMVAARNEAASASLTPQFRAHTIGRAYLTLVAGIFDGGECTARLRQTARRVRVAGPTEEGMDARTLFTPEAFFQHPEHGPVTLVRATLFTGRTHQIRVHASHLGHPVLGDDAYGGLPAARLCLHAAHLSFVHPDGHTLAFDAPLPPDFAAVLAACAPIPV